MIRILNAAGFFILAAVPVCAQEAPLFPPPFEPPVESPAEAFERFTQIDPQVRLAQAPSLPVGDPLGVDGQRQPSGMPPGTRPGVFQGVGSAYFYLPRLEDDSIGLFGFETYAKFGVPFPRRESPLLITPRHRIAWLDGPDFTDVPPRLHDLEVELQHFRRINDLWMFNGAVTMGLYADDHSLDSSEAFRVNGRALGIRQLTSRWQGVVGVVYLNRAGLSVVPAAGLMYDRGDFKADLIFPRPRFAWLMPGSSPDACEQNWLYVQGELGGNLWAVKREDGRDDTLSYGDFRFLLGYEQKRIGGVSTRAEFGYVFAREIEYESEAFDSSLDDTMLLRWIVTY